jgi:hypothetical protein
VLLFDDKRLFFVEHFRLSQSRENALDCQGAVGGDSLRDLVSSGEGLTVWDDLIDQSEFKGALGGKIFPR